jgi:hypothetical protein
MLRAELPGGTVRCRLRADRISVELDVEVLDALPDAERARLVASVDRLWREAAVDLPVRLEPYRRGSAFLRVLT